MEIDNNVSMAHAFMLILAMGLHSVFEGFQLGLFDNFRKIIVFSVLILMHKWNEAFQMGLSLVKGGIDYSKALIYIVVYSLLTPAGMLIGRLLRQVSHDNHKLLGVLMAIPVGIFIYIAIVEIILEEFLVAEHKILKFVFLLVGVAFVYGITLIEEGLHG
jgi:zinc transporter 1/2/3